MDYVNTRSLLERTHDAVTTDGTDSWQSVVGGYHRDPGSVNNVDPSYLNLFDELPVLNPSTAVYGSEYGCNKHGFNDMTVQMLAVDISGPQNNGPHLHSHVNDYFSLTTNYQDSLVNTTEWIMASIPTPPVQPPCEFHLENNASLPTFDLIPEWGLDSHSEPLTLPDVEEVITETGAIFRNAHIWICNTKGCSKRFEKRHEYNKHARCHHRPHKCSVPGCPYRAYLRKDLDRHLTSVHQTAKVPCPIEDCLYSRTGAKRGLSRHDALKRHLKSHIDILGQSAPDLNG